MKKNNFKNKPNTAAQLQFGGFQKGYVKGYSKGHTEGVEFTIKNYSAILLICLRDKFDFTPEQLQEITNHINSQFDSVDLGYVTFDDILATIEQETGLHVEYTGGVDLANGPDFTGGEDEQ